MLCDDLDGWDGEVGGSFQKGGDIQQKITQYYEIVIVQLKINTQKKKKNDLSNHKTLG